MTVMTPEVGEAGSESLLALWSRGAATEITLPGLRGRTVEHRPTDLRTWEIPDRILAESGSGEDDGGNGLHADVVVVAEDGQRRAH